MTFDQWLATVPASMQRDPIWKRADYRLATYAGDVAWDDASLLVKHPATLSAADQLFRSVGSIGAHISEGYSRGSGADRIRYYEYALGEAREARGWYWKSRGVLGEEVAAARIGLIDQVVRLLLTAIKAERKTSSKPLR